MNRQPLVLLCIFWAIIQCVQLDSDWTRMDDDAHFILHAQSILVNHSYNDPNFVYNEDVDYIPKNTSPGWPLMLVPFLYLFGRDLLILKMLVVLLGLVSGVVLFRIMQNRLDDFWLSFFITGIYYFSMTTIVYSKVIYSEWPYLLLSLIIICRCIEKHQESIKTGPLILTGILLGVLLSFRFIAIALILAVTVDIVFSHVHKMKIFHKIRSIILLLTVPFLLYQTVLFIVQPETGPGYKEQFLSKDLYYQEEGQATFKDIVYRIPDNARAFIERIPHTVFGRSWYEYLDYRYPRLGRIVNPLIVVLGIIMTLLISIGFLNRMIRHRSVIEYYVLFYLAIMMVIWFHYEVYRYLMPVAIFLVYYMVIGISAVIQKIIQNRTLCKSVITVLLISIFIINLFQAAIEIYRYKFSSHSEKLAFAPNYSAVVWLKENVNTREIIIADDARWYALETGLSVTPSPIFRNIEKVYQYIQQFPDSILVINSSRYFHRVCMIPVLQKYGAHFNLLEEFGNIQIYRFLS
ncbi:hypothetical protein JW824_10765 [bacterium]|nr:hypothetical protein [bacterium]